MKSPSYRRKAFIAFVIIQIISTVPIILHANFNDSPDSCTIFTVSQDGTTFFCNKKSIWKSGIDLKVSLSNV